MSSTRFSESSPFRYTSLRKIHCLLSCFIYTLYKQNPSVSVARSLFYIMFVRSVFLCLALAHVFYLLDVIDSSNCLLSLLLTHLWPVGSCAGLPSASRICVSGGTCVSASLRGMLTSQSCGSQGSQNIRAYQVMSKCFPVWSLPIYTPTSPVWNILFSTSLPELHVVRLKLLPIRWVGNGISAVLTHISFITKKAGHLFMLIGNLNFLFGEAAALSLSFSEIGFFLQMGGRSSHGCHLCSGQRWARA